MSPAAPHFFGAVWERSKDHQCFVTVPDKRHEQFPLGATVIITLADEPAVRIRSYVRDTGRGGRYAKIMRRRQAELADRFAKDADVRVELVEDERNGAQVARRRDLQQAQQR